ncbi:hypothetical protein [Streptomyces sp. NPDC004830]
MKTSDLVAARRLLTDALSVVAADAPTQTAWLDRHRVHADEIALDFENAFRASGRLAEHHQISEPVVDALREIDAVFAGMSGQEHAERWTRSALHDDAGWSRVRQLARHALPEMTGGYESPLPTIQVIR